MSTPDARKRILILTTTFPRWQGDTEPAFVLELSRRLAQRFEVTVLAPHCLGAAPKEEFDGLRVIRYRYAPEALETLAYNGGIMQNLRRARWKYLLVPLLLLAQATRASALLRASQYDLIHAHWLIPQGLAALWARHGEHPSLLCTSHGGDLYALARGIAGKIMRRVARKADFVTVVSEAMRRHVIEQGIAVRGLEVIPMGADLTVLFTPGSEARAMHEFLFVGRLVPKKGVEVLIRALAIVVQQNPQTRLTIVGDGPERESLQSLAAQLGLSGHIVFEGAQPQSALPERFRRCTALAFPSVIAADNDQEGLGLVLVEALGCECPVICSDLEATRDVITHGLTGIHYPPGDHNALARQMLGVLDDPAGAAAMGRNGRNHVLSRFDWDAVSARYTDLIDKIVGIPGKEQKGHI
ncbi:MAG: glycosyltransferase family 4 protein [Pseudomonadota bacterium]